MGKQISRVFCGYNQTACIDTDGKLYTWGDSRTGQLGHGIFLRYGQYKEFLSNFLIPFLQREATKAY